MKYYIPFLEKEGFFTYLKEVYLVYTSYCLSLALVKIWVHGFEYLQEKKISFMCLRVAKCFAVLLLSYSFPGGIGDVS